jgi:hypothetical protein
LEVDFVDFNKGLIDDGDVLVDFGQNIDEADAVRSFDLGIGVNGFSE